MWRKTKQEWKENKGKAARYRASDDNTTQLLKNFTTLFFFPFSCFAFSKNGKISCIEYSICCCSLSLTLPPRAQYYTILSNFLFCLSSVLLVGEWCVYVCMVEAFISLLSLRSLSCVCVSCAFGPEREHLSIWGCIVVGFYLFPIRTFMSLYFPFC
jgi:hypothetical protein